MKKILGSILVVFLLIVSGVSAFDPVLKTGGIPNQKWDEEYPWTATLDLSQYFSDADGDNLTYDYTRTDTTTRTDLDTDIGISITGSIVTFTLPTDEDWTGNNKVIFTADDGTVETPSNEVSIIKEVPAYCDVTDADEKRGISIKDIEFDDDEYKIGDIVKVDIEDVKATTEDLEDVEVEVCLYNVDDAEEIECWEIDEKFDIDEDDEEDYELEFTIPNSEDIGKKDNYRLVVFVKADGDETGKDHCVQASEEIEIERETHDVIVKDVVLSPTTAQAGETVQITVKVENIGTKDEDDVYVVLKDAVLGINLESTKFDLDDYTDSDNDHTVRFMITIPQNAKAQDYILEPMVYFDDADETNAGEFVTLKVEGVQVIEKKDVLAVTSGTSSINASDGKDVSLHLMITNNEANDLDATVELSTIGTWAENIAPQAVSLHTGDNNIYLPLTLKDVSEGKYTATVVVKSVGNDFETKQSTLSFDVTGETGKGITDITGSTIGGLKQSSIFWIIGDVVLVIVALFFIKAIFFGGKKE